MNKLLFRQFFHDALPQYQFMFASIESGGSRYKDGPNLFGKGPIAYSRYTNSFHLELIYD